MRMWFWLQLASVGFWALINILDSLLVHHYHRHPMVLGWNQSYWSLCFIAILALVFPIPVSAWVLPLLLAGVVAYMGDIVFWRSLDVIDVSIANIAWALLSLFLAVGGFLVFRESWTPFQTAGAILVLSGVGLLSLWHRRITSVRPLLLLPLLAALYTPFYLIQKSALLDGETILAAFYWLVLGRETTSFALSFCVPRFRRRIRAYMPHATLGFHALNGIIVTLFFAACYLTTWAFAEGPVSLVGLVGDVQPFIVLFLAWVFVRLCPRFAPRELLTKQSVRIKLVSFLVVFTGLALLAFSQ